MKTHWQIDASIPARRPPPRMEQFGGYCTWHRNLTRNCVHDGGVTPGGPIGDLVRDDALTLPSMPGTAELFANDETAARIFGVPGGTYRAIASGGRK